MKSLILTGYITAFLLYALTLLTSFLRWNSLSRFLSVMALALNGSVLAGISIVSGQAPVFEIFGDLLFVTFILIEFTITTFSRARLMKANLDMIPTRFETVSHGRHKGDDDVVHFTCSPITPVNRTQILKMLFLSRISAKLSKAARQACRGFQDLAQLYAAHLLYPGNLQLSHDTFPRESQSLGSTSWSGYSEKGPSTSDERVLFGNPVALWII